jgi:hypothetical protein
MIVDLISIHLIKYSMIHIPIAKLVAIKTLIVLEVYFLFYFYYFFIIYKIL